MLDLTVTLVGDPDRADQGVHGSPIEGERVPYRELPRVRLEEDEHTSLIDALHRAANGFSVDPGSHEYIPSVVAFYQHSDEAGYRRNREIQSLLLVDERGRLSHRAWFRDAEVTIAAVRRAAVAGALDGDPLRPYLILRSPQGGNGVFLDFQGLVLAYLVVRDLMGLAADAQGATEAVRRLWGAARRILRPIEQGSQLLSDHAVDWSDKGLSPHDLRILIEREPRDSAVLATLLDASTEDVEAYLRSQGFQQNEWTRLWELDDSTDAATLRRVTRRIEQVEELVAGTEGVRRLTRIVQEIVEEEVPTDGA